MTWLKLVEGYMPMQMISELAGSILVFALVNWALNRAGMGIPKFWAGVGVWIYIQLYLKYRIYPPIPFSVRAIYGTVSGCGIFMWVSGSEDAWQEFKRPIINVMDGISGFHKGMRTVALIVIPLALGGFAYNSFLPSFEEPIELRTVHPAPPATTKVHGKTFVLQVVENPYRVNNEGKYDQAYTDARIVEQAMGRLMKDVNDPNYNPWDPNAEGYTKYVREGGRDFLSELPLLSRGQPERAGAVGVCLQPDPGELYGRGNDCAASGDVRILAGVERWDRAAGRRVPVGVGYAAVGAAPDGG